jgi:hypothetical protein
VSETEAEQAVRAAHLEAAPAAALAALLDVGLAVLSAVAGWHLFIDGDWWLWLLLAVPAAVVAGAFWFGMTNLGISDENVRDVRIGLLAVVAAANLVGILLVIGSLLSGSSPMTGGQLLASALVVLIVNQISFALIFWELDSGGPEQRSQTTGRPTPDFQFPQDDNPTLSTPGWKPSLGDYLYVAVTNSIAFSPTDTMPLSHRAKLYMTFESVISAITVLIVAARAVNVLQS